MLRLVPEWARHYDEFWDAVIRRNLWFIKLRYFFVLLLVAFLIGGEFLLEFSLTETQIIGVLCIGLVIFFYNIIIQLLRERVGCVIGKFNCLHLSLVQMILDLITLMVLIYFTGIIESPMYMFFIFQMVIGSLILPGYVVYTIAGFIIAIFSMLVFLQHFNLIETHLINGLFLGMPDHKFAYILLFLIVFGSMLVFTVYLANKIARSLYMREQQLRESLDKLSEAEIAKQKYIMGVVHEIKTPISAVQSLLELILDKFLGPISNELQGKLERAKTRTSEALHLINNILRISKLKLLNITSSEILNIDEIILGIVDKQTELVKSKNVEIKFDDKRSENKVIVGDKVLVELALSNILANAIKYNLDEGIIEIALYDKDNFLMIEVCDNGIGIPKEETEKVFQQFYRASNIKKIIPEGSGLGLALVMEIIQRYKGEIKVWSPSRFGTVDRPGSCFQIKWPYSDVIEEQKKPKLESIKEGV